MDLKHNIMMGSSCVVRVEVGTFKPFHQTVLDINVT